MPRLLVEISSHGYGHLAQVAPVLQALRRRRPDAAVTVRSALPETILRARIGGDLKVVSASGDVGMVMASAMDVQAGESARAYARFHRGWGARVGEEASTLRTLAPDLIVSDVPYLTLAAAARAGIPAIAMCSLHWGDIYGHYCSEAPGAADIRGEIMESYGKASVFLQFEPHMPMAELPRRRPVGPVGLRGTCRRRELDRRLDLHESERLVLIGLGGVATRLPVESWPQLPGISWLVPAAWEVRRRDFFAIEALGMSFADAVCTCDLLITKPGYGTFVEAACHGIPVLYVQRGDWPEEPYLTAWLHSHTTACEVERQALEQGEIAEAMASLLGQARGEGIALEGVDETAAILAGSLPPPVRSLPDSGS